MSEPASGPPPPTSSRLDEIVVVGALAILAASTAGLFLVTVPQANLPIIAGLIGLLGGSVIGAYAGYRWGASASASPKPTKQAEG